MKVINFYYEVVNTVGDLVIECDTKELAEEFIKYNGHPDWKIYQVTYKEV